MKGGRLQHQQKLGGKLPATCRKLQTDFPGIFTNHFTQNSHSRKRNTT